MPLGLAIVGCSLISAALAIALHRLRAGLWLSALTGGLTPGLLIVGLYFYWESQQPYGPYFAVVGLVYGGPALVFGLASAFATVLIAREMGEEGMDSNQ